MPERYRHTQIGYVMIGGLGGGMVLVAVVMAAAGFNWIALAVLVVLAVALVLMPTLTVSVDERAVRLRFGLGLIRASWSLGDIRSCRVVKSPWYYGWGIRLIPRGWLFRVSGLMSVDLAMKRGRQRRIGTDDPDGLLAAIQQAMAETPA